MSSKAPTSVTAAIAGGEDSIPLLLRNEINRYRDHADEGDDADAEDDEEMLRGTERLNSPPPYLKLDPTSSSLVTSRQIWRAGLLRFTLIVSCIIFGLVVGAVLENLGHVVPLGTDDHAMPSAHTSLLLQEVVNDTDSTNASDDILKWVKSPSANSFRANNFMGYVNMIYLSLLTSRVAVIPPLVPSTLHLGQEDRKLPFVSFSNVFDVPRLRSSLNGHPIIDWKDLKRARYDEPWNRQVPPLEGVEEKEELGCWSVNRPFQRDLERLMELGAWQKSFPGLASLLYARGRREALNSLPADLRHPSPNSQSTFPPDEALTCIDDMYAVGSWYEYEWEFELSPAWRHVGRYVRFNETVDTLAEAYVRRVLGVGVREGVPDQFIFGETIGTANRECFAPLSEFAKKIEQIRQDLRNGTSSTNLWRRQQNETSTQTEDSDKPTDSDEKAELLPIIVTSDEKNQTWYTSDVAGMGWYYVDHHKEDTANKLGKWWPALIDAAVLSRARGMVGVRRSTMSLVAALRVRDWNNGPTRLVDWYDGHSKRRRSSTQEGDEFKPVDGRDEWYN
ncbi:hypothetical protein FRB96_003936 [Tulasnella sp. 330]|nr:hypothetical protein FRB96_003936 [Tulasnella sp. 330]